MVKVIVRSVLAPIATVAQNQWLSVKPMTLTYVVTLACRMANGRKEFIQEFTEISQSSRQCVTGRVFQKSLILLSLDYLQTVEILNLQSRSLRMPLFLPQSD